MPIIAIKEFSEKYNVPTSTLYYTIRKKFVKRISQKLKYGRKSGFDEDAMVKYCMSRLIIEPSEEYLAAVNAQEKAQVAANGLKGIVEEPLENVIDDEHFVPLVDTIEVAVSDVGAVEDKVSCADGAVTVIHTDEEVPLTDNTKITISADLIDRSELEINEEAK